MPLVALRVDAPRLLVAVDEQEELEEEACEEQEPDRVARLDLEPLHTDVLEHGREERCRAAESDEVEQQGRNSRSRLNAESMKEIDTLYKHWIASARRCVGV